MLETLKITDNVYFDPATNAVFLTIERITLTLTLAEYCSLYENMTVASKSIANLITVADGLNKILNSSRVSDNYINSGSSKI